MAAALLASACATTSPLAGADTAAIDRLIALVGERLAIAADVARTKWNSGAPIEDLAREQQIVSAVGAGAMAYDVPRDLAERFFRGQIEASKIIQRTVHAEYTAARQPQLETVRDLDSDIRPELDRLTPALMHALGEALPILQRRGGRQLLEARSRRLSLDAPGSRAASRVALTPLLDVSR